MDVASAVLKGDRKAVARLLTQVEDGYPGIEAILSRLYEHSGKARTIGITGWPGAGKSTLVYALAAELRRRRTTVGIIAIDPSSPFTQGALLGDRVRMQQLATDPGVFIRSMATRGATGGLASTTLDAMTVLDAFGMDVVMVETVGAGQDEVDVVRAAQTVVMVTVPDAGDAIQSLKAGILETADIFVVNKADKPGADAVVANLRQLISLQPADQRERAIPIVKTVATKNRGIPALADAVEAHYAYLQESGKLALRNAERLRFQVLMRAQQQLLKRLRITAQETGLLEQLALDPYTAAGRLVKQVAQQLQDAVPREVASDVVAPEVEGVRNGRR